MSSVKNFNIRPANINDAEGIAKIHVGTWQFAYKGQLSDDYLDSLSVEKRTERWKEILNKPQLDNWSLVAELNGQIVGFCTVGKSRDEDADSKIGELWAIYIDPQYMDKGIGTALMNEGLKILKGKGFNKATLWVLESNDKTRGFYEAKGWTTDGKTKTEKQGDVELHVIRYSINL